RFWSSLALTPEVIHEGMSSLRPLADYDRLWKAGQSRQCADWLVGMNITRAATVTMQDLFSVGRVQTAVLALLVDRRRERESFKPQPYWLLAAQFSNEKGQWRGIWFKDKQTRFENKEDAEKIAAKIAGQTGAVLSVKKQKKRQPPPLLFSLTDLQQDANKKFGMTAQETLTVAQKLYEERKCLSYPRTDSKVLGVKNVEMARGLVQRLSKIYPPLFSGADERLIGASNKRVFNDAKLTDHHALIPLAPIPADAGEKEKKIYGLVIKRFAAAFHPDCEYEQTEIITGVCDETFRTKGKIILKPGWRAVYGVESERPDADSDEPDQENLPPLQKDDPTTAGEVEVQEKKTTPPPEYTEALLLKDMTNPARFVSEDDLKKIFRGDVGLGTQATRAQIIETLLKRSYVVRKKKWLLAADKGCFLIDTLRRFSAASQIASVEETARWEMQLNRIAEGGGESEPFLDEIKRFVETAVEEIKAAAGRMGDKNAANRCPNCGGDIIEGKRGYGCSRWREEDGGCKFVIWKVIDGKKITPLMLRNLLTKRRIGPLPGFSSEERGAFSACLHLVQSEEGWKVEVQADDSPPSKTAAKSLGACPDCGGEIVEGKKGFGCENWREKDGGCRFVIWKTVAKKRITKTIAAQLLKNGKTGVIEGFQSKQGKSFSARLKLARDEAGRTQVVFDLPD
ncbi:MAG: topoisomerase C-terminal repeat-containing protein, partial [Candidatus Omnitrophica bacterium]|nr:topoisomerase C-terminal repeat-containing protein [Candidatus Omnitrophota bacterium]